MGDDLPRHIYRWFFLCVLRVEAFIVPKEESPYGTLGQHVQSVLYIKFFLCVLRVYALDLPPRSFASKLS
jgi:hypothetical protein